MKNIVLSSLNERAILYLEDMAYKLMFKCYSESIVTDSLITISYGLIVPETVFNKLTSSSNFIFVFFIIFHLSPEILSVVPFLKALSIKIPAQVLSGNRTN